MITTEILGGAVMLSGNPVEIKCSGASIPAGASNYEIMLRVVSEDGKLYGAPFEDAIAPDSSGEALFDISGYVDQPVRAVFQYPPSGVVVAYPTQAFNIQIQAGERYVDSSNELQESWGSLSSIFQILKGGISPRQITALRDLGTNFYTKYIVGGKFLTARPWQEIVHPDQPMKLWFMYPGSTTCNLKFSLAWSDGTYTYHTYEVNLWQDYLYEFNVNPKLLGIDIESGNNKVLFFDVELDGKSESRRFEYDWIPVERPVFLMFANTFGGVDDVYFRGFIKDQFITVSSTVTRPMLRTDTVYDGTILTQSRTGQNKWTINSGWKEFTTIQYYRDLLVSKQVWYLYTNVNQTYTSIIPVLVEDNDMELFDRVSGLHSMDLVITEAHISPHSFDNRQF